MLFVVSTTKFTKWLYCRMLVVATQTIMYWGMSIISTKSYAKLSVIDVPIEPSEMREVSNLCLIDRLVII